jgi:glycine oxidase
MTDVVIVGGGIIGLACAYELQESGASVTVLEYGKTGMQATNAAAGMLAPLIEAHDEGLMFDLCVRALREIPDDVRTLEQQVGFDLELQLDGILKVAFSGEQLEDLRQRHAWLAAAGHELQLLGADECREAEPRISERVVGGLYSPGEGSVSNQLLALAFERAAQSRGAVIRNRAPVTGFRTAGARITAVRTPTDDIPCDTVVIAAGARSGQIASKLPLPSASHLSPLTSDRSRPTSLLPVRPIRGQMIALGGMSTPIRSIVWGPDGYLVPRANGLVFAGATVEDVGFRRRTTRAGLQRMRTMANTLVPQLRAAKHLFEWAGLRPASPDALPLIGPLPAYPNVIAATAHYRNGILLSAVTARLIAHGLDSHDWTPTAPFSLSRFHAAELSS